MTEARGTDREPGRSLSVWGWLVIVIVYLGLIQGVTALSTRGLDSGYAEFPDAETLRRALLLPVGLSAVFVWAIVWALGWWRPVVHDDRSVRRWVRVVPILMALTIVVGADYVELFDRGVGYILTFLVGAFLIGVAEEGMFRGLGVVTFRRNSYPEAKVALFTCLVFGGAHATNVFTEGPSALLQVLVTAVAGYFFYLTRRVSKGLLVPIVLHGLWDLSLFTGNLGDEPYLGSGLFILMDVVLAVVLLVRRHKIEPEPESGATPPRRPDPVAGAGPR